MNNLDGLFEASESPSEYGKKYAEYLAGVISRLDFECIEKFIEILEKAHSQGATVFFAGNGGSASTASHWANDLTLATRYEGIAPFRSIGLVDNVSVLTALGNDCGYENIFVRQLEGLCRPGDVLVAISASGNSPNLVRAVEYINAHEGTTVGLTGFDGGRLKEICHLSVHADTPKGEYGPVEDAHLVLDHLVVSYLQMKFGRSSA